MTRFSDLRKILLDILIKQEPNLVGPFDVYFLNYSNSQDWMKEQADAFKSALDTLSQPQLEKYNKLVKKRIKKVVFNDGEYNALYSYFRLIVIGFVPNKTDNPLYLASLLVQHAAQMAQSKLRKLKARQTNACQTQLEFLSLVPDSASICEIAKKQMEKI